MNPIDQPTLERLLLRAQKPGRYCDGELNSIVKEHAQVRMALSFPDLYEVAMSNNGLRILYDIANGVAGCACERVFAVAADFEALLRNAGIPLYTLETRTPLRDLDAIGFNIASELLYTNVLQVLDLGGVPLLRAERGEDDPVIIAGGEAISNPLPMLDFIDAFFLGDGEEGIVDIVNALLEAKRNGTGRQGRLDLLAGIEGLMLSERYAGWKPGGPTVKRRVYRGAELKDPARPLVPNLRITQERSVVEVSRGCSNLCNFCHAGYYDLPYRRYDHRDVARRVLALVDATGYDEVTLSSLSISDYPDIIPLINHLLPALTERGVSVSLPSLRVDPGTLPLIESISDVRKASLTFAVESASEEIRGRANKKLANDDLLEIITHVVRRGWRVVKLYFMLGLPGWDEHDEADDIVALLRRIVVIAGRRVDINVTLSPFIPKPHTPFQWEKQLPENYFFHAIDRIKAGLPRSVKIKNHNVNASLLEGVFARGDARLGSAILASYREGNRFDAWDEHLRIDVWLKNLDAAVPEWRGFLDARDPAEPLPWGMIETGFERLILSRRGACADFAQGNAAQLAGELDTAPIEEALERFKRRYATVGRARLVMAKQGSLKFISHIDFGEVVKRGLRRADLPVTSTQGFNKREKISSGYPVPLGIGSEAEIYDIELHDELPADALERLNAALPAGAAVLRIRPLADRESIMAATALIEYRVGTRDQALFERLLRGIGEGVTFTRESKRSSRQVSSAEVIQGFDRTGPGEITLRLVCDASGPTRIDALLAPLAGLEGDAIHCFDIVKVAQYRQTPAGFALLE